MRELEVRTCPFCGAMSPPSLSRTPHDGGPCPLKVKEHEKRLALLGDPATGRWDVQITVDTENWDALMDDGWEPFAAFLNIGYAVAFRRRRTFLAEPLGEDL